jgi:hypothetical protein
MDGMEAGWVGPSIDELVALLPWSMRHALAHAAAMDEAPAAGRAERDHAAAVDGLAEQLFAAQQLASIELSECLDQAAKDGNTTTIRALLEAKASVNAIDEAGQTALFHAVRNHRYSAVVALVNAKANVNARDGDGCTPLDIAEGWPGVVVVVVVVSAEYMPVVVVVVVLLLLLGQDPTTTVVLGQLRSQSARLDTWSTTHRSPPSTGTSRRGSRVRKDRSMTTWQQRSVIPLTNR